MADADQQVNTSPTNQSVGVTKSELDAKLGEVQEQLRAMNDTFRETAQALASQNKPAPKPQPTAYNDDVVFDAGKLQTAVSQTATEIANRVIMQEREMNTAVYSLVQDYPEIQSDPVIQKAVREAQAALPEAMRNTPAGLEAAVLKTVTKAGLMPKSKRSAPIDDDISVSPRGNGNSNRPSSGKRQKIDPLTLEFAQLVGRDINDPAVIKGLEDASNRDNYGKYR